MIIRKAVFVVGLCLSLVLGSQIQAKEVIDETCYKQILSGIDVSDKDINSYKKVFKLLREEKFSAADKALKKIDNEVLFGHVLAEKYLSKKYDSKFSELKEWLEKYADHPQTRSIYHLALRKKKAGDEMPIVASEISKPRYYSPYSWFNEDYASSRPEYAAYLRKKVVEFRKYINSGKTKKAKALLEDATFRKRIPDVNYDAMSATLALVYFLDNEDAQALKWVQKPVRRSNDSIAMWFGGLAAYRSKDYKKAAEYFSKLGGLKNGDEWMVSGGAYWAYRAYLKLGNKKEAKKWLNAAAKRKRTFYGILANQKLGNAIEYNWKLVAYHNDFSNYAYVSDIVESAAMCRALVLIYAKNPALAEKELKYSYKNMSPKQQELALYVAKQYDLHYAGIDIANGMCSDEASYDEVAYPAPEWEPKDGWKVDQTLVWGLVRQESAFSPMAQSGAGARGLMQLMPNTAYHVTKTRDTEALMDIAHNLSVGQQYVAYLLQKPYIDGNLFFLATAYNAGPGNLYKWQKRIKYKDDPLLFVEAIPARETRLYVKRVMTNYWIYNMRFEKENLSLEQVAAGKWPTVEEE